MRKIIFLLMILNVFTSSLILCVEPQKKHKEASQESRGRIQENRARILPEAQAALAAFYLIDELPDSNFDHKGLKKEPNRNALKDVSALVDQVQQVFAGDNEEEKALLKEVIAIELWVDKLFDSNSDEEELNINVLPNASPLVDQVKQVLAGDDEAEKEVLRAALLEISIN